MCIGSGLGLVSFEDVLAMRRRASSESFGWCTLRTLGVLCVCVCVLDRSRCGAVQILNVASETSRTLGGSDRSR